MGFPERLKELRKETGLTQKQIAEKLNTSQQNYAKWETNKANPTRAILEKLASFFGVTTDYLLGNSNYKTEIPEGEEFERELDKAIDESVGYEGEPVTEHDREVIKEVLRNYFKNQQNK